MKRGAAAAPRRGWLLCVALFALAGCASVGPDFKLPAPPAATGYLAPGDSPANERDTDATPTQTLALGASVATDWWTLFCSPALDDLVRQAIAGSQTLAAAKARLAQSKEALAAASSARYPQVGVNASATHERLSATSFGLQPGVFPLPPNFNLYQVGTSATYDPDIFGSTRRRIEHQGALADFQRYEFDAAYLALTGNTVAQAIQVAALRAQLKAVEELQDIDRQNLTLARKQRQVGTLRDADVVAAEGQLAATQTLAPGIAQQISVTRHSLAVLVGRAAGEWSPLDFDLSTLTLPRWLPLSLPSALVHQRPDILAAEAQLRAASARIGVATAQLYPDVTLSASFAGTALVPGQLFNPAGLIWSIAAGLAQPVFDGGMREAQRRAALADFKATAADYQQTVLQAFAQVADILQAFGHDAQLLAAQTRALAAASESVRLQRISYDRGASGVLTLLDAQRQYQQALLGFVRAQSRRYLDTVELQVAMGGGLGNAAAATVGTP